MTRSLPLRATLAVTGFLAIYLPVLMLWAVTFSVSTEEQIRTPGTEQMVMVSNDGPITSPWVVGLLVAMVPAAAALAWWGAGRAVGPFVTIQQEIDTIGADRLHTRIDDSGPIEARALASSFNHMLDRLETASNAQRRLIDDVSHELRTPLAVIITNADVLLAGPEPTLDGLSSGLRRSRTTARRLATTIENLLVDARSSARAIARQPTSLLELVNEVADELAVLADREHVTLLVRGDDQVRCSLDRASVRRAVLNLVDNAVQHAPPHTRVEIDVTNDAGTATVAVTDHGPGIAPQDQAHVFDRFWRSDPVKGTGLGLAIVAHVATAHGGSVSLTSPGPTGPGCRFALTIPATDTDR